MDRRPVIFNITCQYSKFPQFESCRIVSSANIINVFVIRPFTAIAEHIAVK
jgi:hypothetical protein